MNFAHNTSPSEWQTNSQIYSHTTHPIIVVDDSLDDRILFAKHMRSFLPSKKSVITFSSGEDLLEYLDRLELENTEAAQFETETPEMIFLDLMMPGMDGIEILQSIKQKSLWNDIPITLVTCSKNDSAIHKAEEAGANAFIAKPFTKLDLMRALNKGSNFSPMIV